MQIHNTEHRRNWRQTSHSIKFSFRLILWACSVFRWTIANNHIPTRVPRHFRSWSVKKTGLMIRLMSINSHFDSIQFDVFERKKKQINSIFFYKLWCKIVFLFVSLFLVTFLFWVSLPLPLPLFSIKSASLIWDASITTDWRQLEILLYDFKRRSFT